MEFETRLQILNESIAFLFDKLSFNQNESDEKTQEMFTKTNSVIALSKQSQDLFRLPFSTSRNTQIWKLSQEIKKYEELEHYFNTSVDKLKTKIFQTKSGLSNLTEEIQNVEDFQTEMKGELTGKKMYLLNVYT